MTPIQLLIVGGGPAGMAAALIAGRSRLTTVVVNAEAPRNAVAHASHGFLTRDGAHSSELLSVARAQLEKYPSVRYVRGEVSAVDKTDSGFVAQTRAGERWLAEKVVFAAGFRSQLDSLALPGIEVVYGRSVFPCPFCDGFEHADQALAVFASSSAAHFAPVVRHWSDDVIVFTNGQPVDEASLEALSERGFRVETSSVARLVHDEGQLRAVRLQDGTEIPRQAGFVGEPHAAPASDLPGSLGVPLATNAWGMAHYEADTWGKTAVPGLYVVGDLKQVFSGIVSAANDGYACVAGIVHELTTAR